MKKGTKKKTPKGQLGDWLDEVPDEVVSAASDFDKALTAKNKAKSKFDNARETLVELMRDTKTMKAPIRGGSHFVRFQESCGVKVEAVGKDDADQ